MDKVQQTNKIVMVIGSISILFSSYSAFSGKPLNDYFFGLLIGVTLLGSAYYNNHEWKKKQNENT